MAELGAAALLTGRAASPPRRRRAPLAEPPVPLLHLAELPGTQPPRRMPDSALSGGGALRWRTKDGHFGSLRRSLPRLTGGPTSARVPTGVGFGTSPRFATPRTLAPTPEGLGRQGSASTSFRVTSPGAMPQWARSPAPCGPHPDPELDSRLRDAVLRVLGGPRSLARSLLRKALAKEATGAFCYLFSDEEALEKAAPSAVAFMTQERLERLAGPVPVLRPPDRTGATVAAALNTADGPHLRVFRLETDGEAATAPGADSPQQQPRSPIAAAAAAAAEAEAERHSRLRADWAARRRALLECTRRREAERAQRAASELAPGVYCHVRDINCPLLSECAPFPDRPSPPFRSPPSHRPRPPSAWLPGGDSPRSTWLRLRRERGRLIMTQPDPCFPTRPLSYVPLKGMAVTQTINVKVM
eukprot:TRINITY_DN20813_c0_g1_i1.p1 TRINITY_DN20813_c0_g1~~TRINITY_DN20813_c0_g1_i1.p1  ORF type:complete len:415 (+),score=73.24 TRINITY_DN20813_c0_g1_i1:90-1334(+)